MSRTEILLSAVALERPSEEAQEPGDRVGEDPGLTLNDAEPHGGRPSMSRPLNLIATTTNPIGIKVRARPDQGYYQTASRSLIAS